MGVLNIDQLPFGIQTRTVLKAFSDLEATQPKMFFYDMFGKSPGITDFSDKETVTTEIERYGRKMAVDVIRGGAGNLNTVGRSTEKEYIPPLFDEATIVNAFELNKRIPGELPTDKVDKTSRMVYYLGKAMLLMRDKIRRAMEYMSIEALWNAVITLKNTESISFFRKSSHNQTPIYDWTDQTNADPIADLTAACYANTVDGKIMSNVSFWSENAFNLFINHTKVKEYLDNRRIEPGFIKPVINAESGANYMGWINVGNYRLDIYTYPQYYEDPITSVITPYIPDDTVVVTGTSCRLDKCFGALSLLDRATQAFSQLGPRIPSVVMGDFIPYYKEEGVSALRTGIQSAPLVIPTQIDGISKLTVV